MAFMHVSIIDPDIKRASVLLQRVNLVDGFSCTHIYTSVHDLLLNRSIPDIILFADEANQVSTDEALSIFSNKMPEISLVLYARVIDINRVVEHMRKKVSGYFHDDASFSSIDIVLRTIRDHQVYVSPNIVKHLFDCSTIEDVTSSPLTKRELRICLLLKDGCSYEEIAQRCSISINTVRFYIKNIYKKYEVKSKVQLFNKLSSRAASIL